MTYPEEAVINEGVAGGSEHTSTPETNRVSGGKRSASDERRFQDSLEDDEVREALHVQRGTRLAARIGARPVPLADG